MKISTMVARRVKSVIAWVITAAVVGLLLLGAYYLLVVL